MKRSNLYERTRWRLGLTIIAIVVVAATIFYTNSIAYKLKLEEQKNVELWAFAQKNTLEATDLQVEACDFTLNSMIMDNSSIPMILTDENYRIVDAMNYPNRNVQDHPDFFERRIKVLRKRQVPIIVTDGQYKNYIFYQQSSLITTLEFFPYFQFTILSVLLLLGYFTFSSSREAEQERVWVGMAKETAHQLGTPITSLMGWIQNLQMLYPDDEELMMVVDEMNTDVELLKLVADRFSKIGTIPKLEPVNVYENLDKHLQYVQQRASRKITFNFPAPEEKQPLFIQINPLLFDWVIENLLKNALDAMAGKGSIGAKVTLEEKSIYIDIKDSGKGIPKRHHKSVFQPGYSTKKRGWGLGLSLCKRIVEKYHNGQIFVLESVENEGTTFRVKLPYHSDINSDPAILASDL